MSHPEYAHIGSIETRTIEECSELKPCPCCGADVKYELRHNVHNMRNITLYRIRCSCGIRTASFRTLAQLVVRWNTRTPDPAAVLREVRESIISLYDTHRDGHYNLSTINEIIDAKIKELEE